MTWKEKVCRIPEIAGVYCLVNKVNGREYIGSSMWLRERVRTHILELRRNRHIIKSLQEDFINYGEHAFEVKILEFNKQHYRPFYKEAQYIKQRQPFYNRNSK